MSKDFSKLQAQMMMLAADYCMPLQTMNACDAELVDLRHALWEIRKAFASGMNLIDYHILKMISPSDI